MDYKLKRSQRKTIALLVRDGQVLVRAPFRVPKSRIDQFVLEKEDWILGKLEAYRKPGIDFDNKSVFLFGVKKTIHIERAAHWSMELGDEILVKARSNMTQAGIEKRMEEYFKEELDSILKKSIHKYSKALKIPRPKYIIRKYSRIHGRCLSNGELAFNTNLYEHSPDFIDYVVLHECAHLIEFNHSAKFYSIIKAHMPNYKEVIKKDKEALEFIKNS